MPWEFKKVEDARMELIEAYENGDAMTDLCRRYGISRKTGYKWLDRYRLSGVDGLKNLSKAPLNPFRIFDDNQINKALDLKYKHPDWGPKKVTARLSRDYPDLDWPSPTRLYEIFKDYHLINSRRLRRRVPATHPLGKVNQSNDVWSADFKGWYLLLNKEKFEPVTITDGHTRYLIRCQHVFLKTVDSIWPIFADAFKEYGLPNRIRTDNGPPFGCLGVGRMTMLSINLVKAGVVPEWINPGHPEENGRHERFHSTLQKAIANPPAKNLKEQITRMEAFQEQYNFERPHEALGMDTPGDHYYCSSRKWDGILRPPEYDTRNELVRKVCPSGCIWLKQEEFFIGQTLTGEYVGLRETDEGKYDVNYGPMYLGKLTLGQGFERPSLKRKKIVRRG